MTRTVVPLLPKGIHALSGACFCGPWVDLPEVSSGWNLVIGVHGGPARGSARLRLETAGAAGIALHVGDEVALHDPRHVVQALPEGLGPRVRVAIDASAALDTRILAYLEAPSP